MLSNVRNRGAANGELEDQRNLHFTALWIAGNESAHIALIYPGNEGSAKIR